MTLCRKIPLFQHWEARESSAMLVSSDTAFTEYPFGVSPEPIAISGTPVISQLDSLSSLVSQHAHAIECKFLPNRDRYQPCHILAPDVDHRLSAIYVDNQFYSFFKVIADAQKLLDVIGRLGKRDDKVAVTQIKRGFAVWVHEPGARYAPPARIPNHKIQPVFGPKACLVVTEAEAYRFCRIQVPDITKPLEAISYRGNYYSIFKQEGDARSLIDIAVKLTQRGDDILIALASEPNILALAEPNAKLV
jgi:hypothetical protein